MTIPEQLDLFTNRTDDLPLFTQTAVTVDDETYQPQPPTKESKPIQLSLFDNEKDVTK